MESRIAQAIETKHPPIALIWSDEKPEGALQFQEGRWGCVMWLAASAVKGRPAVCDAKSFGCFGGGVGMGFGEQYKSFPGNEEGFCHFLSSGIDGWAEGPAVAEKVKPFLSKETFDNFVHGERYVKTPEDVKKFIRALPIMQIPKRYVLFLPLADVDAEKETPQTVILFADPDELSALVVLANYGRGSNENVFIPFAAGCQTIGIYPYREAESDRPRAVVGLTDLSARVYIRKQLGDNLLSFAMPFALFQEMEANVEGSFLQRHTWQELIKAKRPG
ncbi:MAG: DUF169 domain-containing protein [Proteobacteria bacterium]|nr:DUF169 domain-containing protein [Pseudomonadota bacterium]MCG2742255.1 DUF169 domain-containing protein [Syntrophaceae bacterium]